MKYVKPFIGFLVAGIAFILAGFYIRTLDTGMCEMIPTGSKITTCYHTFQNSNIYIYPTGTLVIEFGLAILIAAFITGLYGYFSDRKNVKPAKIEPKPAQAQVNP